MLPCQQLVQQGNEQFLAGRLPEDDLEADIRKRVYKMRHVSFFSLHASKIGILANIHKFVYGEVAKVFTSTVHGRVPPSS